MPRTRTQLSRAAKESEILTAAERRLRAGGYQELSIAGIARELGVAQAAIYWYFASKDELVVAVGRRMLEKIKARKPKDQSDVIEKIIWFAGQLDPFFRLRAAVEERARSSAVVGQFFRESSAMLHAMLTGVLSSRIPEAEIDLAVESVATAVDGAYVRGLSPRERKRIWRFTLERILGDDPRRK